jgi:hypothetical protein
MYAPTANYASWHGGEDCHGSDGSGRRLALRPPKRGGEKKEEKCGRRTHMEMEEHTGQDTQNKWKIRQAIFLPKAAAPPWARSRVYFLFFIFRSCASQQAQTSVPPPPLFARGKARNPASRHFAADCILASRPPACRSPPPSFGDVQRAHLKSRGACVLERGQRQAARARATASERAEVAQESIAPSWEIKLCRSGGPTETRGRLLVVEAPARLKRNVLLAVRSLRVVLRVHFQRCRCTSRAFLLFAV